MIKKADKYIEQQCYTCNLRKSTMGLAASQARLLTITSRKSRAQFENMRLSHQKLALSRNLTDISNEYQNSLNQTKLYYDFYGVNSTDTPLTYDLLMSPSSINDYTPTLITNNQNQVILSTPYAEAAKAAGIPMEGLGCQPSSVLRDTFMQALAEYGVITQNTADIICGIDYNQGAGLGNSNLLNTITTTGDYDALLNKLEETQGQVTALTNFAASTTQQGCIYYDGVEVAGGNGYVTMATCAQNNDSADEVGSGNSSTVYEDFKGGVSLADLLDSANHIYLMTRGSTGRGSKWSTNYAMLTQTVNNVVGQLGDELSNLLGDSAEDAIAYANLQMDTYCWGDSDNATSGEKILATRSIKSGHGTSSSNNKGGTKSLKDSMTYLSLSNAYRSRSSYNHGKLSASGSLDLSAFVQAWFTYFMQYMFGLGTAEANNLNVAWNQEKTKSNFADKDALEGYMFTFKSTVVSDNEALIANFYDTLFNQICMNGWAPNSQIDKDSNYLKEMLQSGMMYVTSMSDDYYFYQNNYATNSLIKEVTDDAAIAAAESKYTTEKARINAKEQELDLKMKNLDTEISSLETEYEAVKKVIENNASKSFTRYDG